MKVWHYISRMLPESRFKENIRAIFYKWMARKWSLPLKKLELLGDKEFFLELRNGLKFISEGWGIFGILSEQLVGSHGYEISHNYQRCYKLKKGDVVVNAGAHIGVFTIFAAKAVGRKGLVIAIEPEKNNLENLKKNIELNSFSNVVVIPKGLWSRRDKKRLYLKSSSIFHLMQNSNETEEIEVDTLDNILGELGVGKVDFIKMDIEGAEVEALKGMERTLNNNNVNLAIAAYHIVNGNQTCKIVIPWLERAGFDIHEEGGFVYAKKLPT